MKQPVTGAPSIQVKLNQTESNQIKPVRGMYLWHMELQDKDEVRIMKYEGRSGETTSWRDS
jgi:hypothetical protein